ncbi:hypothetical protein [Treponema primitia]|uniref:hypothetical protein n=1 Tax=Treponema primitia TaxID=88058 RepID=UPI0002555294|nr:hypothetical protein [Treponema primitia]
MALKHRRIVIIILIILGILALGPALYTLRSPVLMVVDDEFTGLYGFHRSWVKQIEISLKLFRRLKVVQIAGGASPDVVAFAAVEAAARPYAALFPFAYRQGARRYAEESPGIPVGVVGGDPRTQFSEEDGLVFIKTDKTGDLYRAGRCAALFARSNGGNILFFTGELVDWNDKDAFLKGLRDQGFDNSPIFVDKGEDYTLPKELSCIIMARAVENYPEDSPSVPMIIFSWVDPGVTAREIKVIFDDSPWALAAVAAKTLHRGGEMAPVSSEILVLKDRIGDAEILRDIQKAIKDKEGD